MLMPDFRLSNLHKRGPRVHDGSPTCAGSDPIPDYADDEDEFIHAVARFRSVNKVNSPTLCHLLWVLKQLGYRKV
jgi:hypothetical protein